jgi:hypothetical protein
MERPLTEEEKLRQKIPLSDSELKAFLKMYSIPFDMDSAGTPWLSNAALRFVLRHF